MCIRDSFHHLYGCGEKSTSLQMKSSFQSKIPMGQHVRKIDTPGAGEYDPEKRNGRGYSYSTLGSSAFAGNTPQCGLRKHEMGATGTAVGPANYDVEHTSITAMLRSKCNPRSPPFGASSRRGDPTSW